MPASGKELGEAASPAGGVQRHARLPTTQVLGHDRLVGGEQPAAGLCIIAGRLLLVSEDGADPLGEHAAVLQLFVIQELSDLGQPAVGERPVVVSGPGVQQCDALEAEQIGKRVLNRRRRPPRRPRGPSAAVSAPRRQRPWPAPVSRRLLIPAGLFH